MPRVFRRDLGTFKTKMTALEFICDTHLTIMSETSVNQTEAEGEILDAFRENTCVWVSEKYHKHEYMFYSQIINDMQLNSLSANFLPTCTPLEVEFFCRQVKLNTLSYRAGKSLGTFENTSRSNWITTYQILPADHEIREFMCQHIFHNSCSGLYL